MTDRYLEVAIGGDADGQKVGRLPLTVSVTLDTRKSDQGNAESAWSVQGATWRRPAGAT
jgi:hypothetical protein